MISEELKNKILTSDFRMFWKKRFLEQELLEISQHILHLENILTYSELKHCVEYDILEQPKCPICGKNLKYSFKKYAIFCSNKCRTTIKAINIVNEKTKQTSIKLWQKEYYTQTEKYKEKNKQTCLIKYNETSYNKSESAKKKRIVNSLIKYNKEYYTQTDDHKKHMSSISRNKYWDTFLKILKDKNIIPLFTKDEYLLMDYHNPSEDFYCNICEKSFKANSLRPYVVTCPHHKYRSSYEIIIKKWLIDELYISNICENERFGVKNNPKRMYHEIDLYLPDYNLGIEFNGLYWHSDLYKDKYFHQEKYLFFKEKGIELIQIFESEWLQKEHIVKSIIKNKLDRIERLKNVISTMIDQNDNRKIIICLDARYHDGSEYLKLGFKQTELTKPKCYYFNRTDMILISSENISVNLLDEFDPTKNENDNMIALKYLRIFDAGNLVFELNI